MNIIESIKEFFNRQKIKHLSKKTEKLMIKESEDEKVVEKLYELANADEDSIKSQVFEHVDIVKVTKNLDNPAILLDEDLAEELKSEHIDEDAEEQVPLDGLLEEAFKEASSTQVKELAKNITDDADKQKMLDNGLIDPWDKPYFIDTFNGNTKTLKNCIKNIDTYTDMMVAKTLENLLPENNPTNRAELEKLKVQVVTLKTIHDLLNYGMVIHVPMLTDMLNEESKLVIAEDSLKELELYETGKKEIKSTKKLKGTHDGSSKTRKIGPEAKIKLVSDLYDCTKLPKEEKDQKLEEIFKYLTQDEIQGVHLALEQKEKYKIEKEKNSHRPKYKVERMEDEEK